jgi:hypothetical protein
MALNVVLWTRSSNYLLIYFINLGFGIIFRLCAGKPGLVKNEGSQAGSLRLRGVIILWVLTDEKMPFLIKLFFEVSKLKWARCDWHVRLKVIDV